MFPRPRLDTYLNDHLAGATFGIELTRRARAANQGTEVGDFLDRLLAEIVADKETLETIMARLGVERSPVKPAGAWALEKVGRLKLNGQLRGYSPLSRLLELEGLQTGVTGKRSLWENLAIIFTDDERLQDIDFTTLLERADHQVSRLGDQRRAAAREALTG
jgi:hypothetical protein